MENDINTVPAELTVRKRKSNPDSAAKDDEESKTFEASSEMSSGNGSGVLEDDGAGLGGPAIKQIAVQKIQERVKMLRQSLLDQMETELSDLTERFLMELQTAETVQKNSAFYGEPGTRRPRRQKRPSGSLPDKEFLPRNSLLTDLFEVNHIQTIYHIFIAILILLFVNTLIYDVVDTGRLNLDFGLIKWAFGNFRSVLFIWVAMMSCTMVLVYPAFHLWANKRVLMKIPSLRQRLWDYLWLAAYFAYIVVAIYAPVKELVIYQLPPASSAIVLMEQVRLIMKTHAFVRSNIPRALNFRGFRSKSQLDNEEDDEEHSPCPDFSKYLYFLFAPTLVYRSSYPRTRRIRWKWVVWNFLQVVGVLFYLYFIFVRFMVPVFRQFGHEPLTAKALVLSVFGCVMPGILVLLCGFFALLHAWLNAFAEMLRFADRMFYKDWWNSSSYAVYYRTWNVVVHDWLYTYVYKDVYELCCRKNRVLPMLVVFAVSATVHEFILSFVFRFFCPILLLLFGGFGMGFAMISNVESRIGNIFMWLTLFMGTGMIVSVYSMEWYARVNCRPLWDGWLDYFVPRSLMCHTTYHS